MTFYQVDNKPIGFENEKLVKEAIEKFKECGEKN